MRWSNRARPYLAVILVVLPVVVEIVVSVDLWGRLPARMPTTFGADGSPSGYGTPMSIAIMLALVQAAFVTAAIGSVFARDREKGRVACAVTAGFVATIAVSWLIIVGLSALTLNPSAWWAILAGPAWAAVPYLLLRTRRAAK